VVECDVPPVVVKVFAISTYDVLEEVPHLHVAASSVVTLIVVSVVPTGSVPVGCPSLMTGGVVSPRLAMLKLMV
jgi:hypothetical protein